MLEQQNQANHSHKDMEGFPVSMLRCIATLQNDNDIQQNLAELLNIVAQYYGCSHGILLEFQKKTNYYEVVSEYIPEGSHGNMFSFFKQLPYNTFDEFHSNFETKELFQLPLSSNQSSSNGLLRILLTESDVTSCFYAPIGKKEESRAVLALHNPSRCTTDTRLLQGMQLFLEEALQKRSLLREIDSVYDTDLLTGFFNYQKYLCQTGEMIGNPPTSLGIVFIDLGKKQKKHNYFTLGDDEIKEAAAVVESFFKQSFYRVADNKFLCFVSNMEREHFIYRVSSLIIEVEASETANFSITYSWETGDEEICKQIEEADLFIQAETTGEEVEYTETSIQKDLLNAIQSKEFEIYFQPKILLKDRTVVGAEALVRRKRVYEDVLVYPAIFVQVYEDHAIIRHLDLYVVDFVCKTLAKWIEEGIAVPISVNFSRITLTEYGIVQTICDICKKYNVPHNLLTIEFTERIAMMNDKAYEQLAEQFEKEGFHLSLDDFGAAYSNLITLAKINIDEIKIDKTLSQNLEHNPKSEVVVKSIIDMCNSLESIDPLAEGIETEYQANKLTELGCRYGQGNYFSPPITVEYFYDTFLKKK